MHIIKFYFTCSPFIFRSSIIAFRPRACCAGDFVWFCNMTCSLRLNLKLRDSSALLPAVPQRVKRGAIPRRRETNVLVPLTLSFTHPGYLIILNQSQSPFPTPSSANSFQCPLEISMCCTANESGLDWNLISPLIGSSS